MSSRNVDIAFFSALKAAAEKHKTNKLEAFAQATAAFASYASDTDMPTEIRLFLTDMLAEFKNLLDGAETVLVKPARNGRPAKPSQHEAAWAWASVYLDLMGGTLDARRTIERKFKKAALKLPGKKGGESLRAWKDQANSSRNNDHIEQHFVAARGLVEHLTNEGMSQSEAADAMLDAVIALG